VVFAADQETVSAGGCHLISFGLGKATADGVMVSRE
jgi:hypothetical protein